MKKTTKTTLERLRQRKSGTASEVNLDGIILSVNFPPITKAQISQEKAGIFAKRELAEIKDDLLSEPIDEQAWNESLKDMKPEDEAPKKPKNLYEQKLSSATQQRFVFLIGPHMICDEDGNPMANDVEATRFIRDLLESEIDLVKAVSEKLLEFSKVMLAKVAPDKKKS